MNKELEQVAGQIRDWGDAARRFELIHFAMRQRSEAFTPAMLPKLWHLHPCCYRTDVYKQAWYHGFYSAASWFLICRLANIGRTFKPDIGAMFDWYAREHPESDWKRVPRPE